MPYTEKGAVEPLLKGETVLVRGIGNSMTPILRSGQLVTVDPITDKTPLSKGDIVLCKVNGHVMMHKITAVKGEQFQISNNHGHINGWTARKNIYGIIIL